MAVDLLHRFYCGMCHGEVEVLVEGTTSVSKHYGVGQCKRAQDTAQVAQQMANNLYRLPS